MRTIPALLWTSGATLVLVMSATIAQPTEVAMAAPVELAAVASHDGDGDPVNGRRVYLRENCYICHGGRVGGGMCPSFRDDPPDESDIDHAIEDGTESGMPSYRGRVSEKEIEDIAAYFESLRTAREPTFTHWWEPGVPSR
jgi:mono/diheme cytochrome c family protein